MSNFGLKEMVTIAFILTVCVFLIVTLNSAHGKEYKEKNVTLTLYKDEMGWCYFGNKDSPTAICNSMELRNKHYLIDDFLQFLDHGWDSDDD